MSKLDQIETAITSLSPTDLARFREWFEAFDAKQFDEKIERDSIGGRLDGLADAAIVEHRAGKTREL